VTDGPAPDLIFLLLALMLPLSALLARRIPLSQTLKMAAGWVGIFAIGLVIAGQRERLRPLWDGAVRTLTGDDQQVVGDTVHIAAAPDGHYYASVTINGVARRMLIDSGATTTALSTATAKAADVDVDTGGFGVMIETANGSIVASRARIGELRVGEIVARDLAATVSPELGDTDLLGMNFLEQLASWRVEGRTLILKPRRSDR
jgi:aspartyl protease family protein